MSDPEIRKQVEKEFANQRAMFDDWLTLMLLHDGIPIDPIKINDPTIPCTRVRIAKADGSESQIVWREGFVGALSKQQVKDYCRVYQEARHGAGLTAKLEAFTTASQECEGMDIPQRLACMSERLSKKGVAVPTGRVTELPPYGEGGT